MRGGSDADPYGAMAAAVTASGREGALSTRVPGCTLGERHVPRLVRTGREDGGIDVTLVNVLVGLFVVLAVVYVIMLLGNLGERQNERDRKRAHPDDGDRAHETRPWGGLGRPGSGF